MSAGAAPEVRLSIADLRASPNALAAHYGRFRVAERTLLTGHSHQAWPDVALEGQVQCFEDAAAHVDDKWGRAFEAAGQVRRGFARLLDDDTGHITLGANTHELLVRLLSALPLRERPRLVTTTGEFHTIRRQLDRLAECGIDLVRVSAQPVATLAERLAEAVSDRTAAVLVSTVLFQNARIVRGLEGVMARCEHAGAALVLDTYHQLGAVPFSLRQAGLEQAFVVGGGYKYLQLGEGNCFLRAPPDCRMRPVVTGWFSEFGAIADRVEPGKVAYGEGPDRFAGATYDPVSHYRGASVFAFFDRMGLDAAFLRRVSQHQVGLLAARFDSLGIEPSIAERPREVPLGEIGGFLALRTPRAGELSRQLRTHGIWTDFRADVLRLGPAPYLSDAQLEAAVDSLGRLLQTPAQESESR